MRMKQLLFVLLFHSFGTGYCQVLPDLKTMLVYVKLGPSSLATCQECILSVAGAVRARHIPKRNEKSMERKVVFEVTASDFGFMMVQQYCSKVTQCNELTVKYPFRLAPCFSYHAKSSTKGSRRSFRYNIMPRHYNVECKMQSLLERI